MLIEFTVGNFRSFKKPVTISLEAAAITSEDKAVDENNLIPLTKNLKLLTSAVVYGANASGKSNLINAFAFIRNLVINSSRESQADEPIKIDLFQLNNETVKKPAYFEVIFLIEQQKYRYGFEVSKEKIEREWLYFTPTIREAELFIREDSKIKVNSRAFVEGRGLEEKTRPNALFLSVVAQFNGLIALKVLKKFRQIGIISGLDDTGYRHFTLHSFWEDSRLRNRIKTLVRSFDIGIENIVVNKNELSKIYFPTEMTEELKESISKRYALEYSTQTIHTVFDADGNPVGEMEFDLEDNESEGTQKLFYLLGPIVDTLSKGEVLFVDEMEARMHPLITCAIIRLFNSLQTNPKRAQLIFTTHDSNLLDRNLFRRDQIWFAEKDTYGASHLYSLVEFKPRNDESFERNYLRGKYGAIPFLRSFDRIFVENEPVEGVSENGA